MVVLWPMLYTDTSESWKLANPRQRLAIASAGIVAEPVSYTHLDVYKRQAPRWISASPTTPRPP